MQTEICSGRIRRSPGWIHAVGLGAATMFLGLALLLIWKFPFRREAIVNEIETIAGGRVRIGSFEEKWFPPGFIAQRVALTDRDGNVFNSDTVALEATYTDLLRSPKALRKIHFRGSHIVLAPRKPGPKHMAFPFVGGNGSAPKLAIGELRFDNAGLDLPREIPAQPPLAFFLHTLILTNIGPHSAVGFKVAIHNPRPSGEIISQGAFGPLDTTNPGRTPLSGTFTFDHADLATHNGIAGILASRGFFQGPLNRIACTGTADVPGFQVHGSDHTVHLTSRFEAHVDAMTGDTVLNRVVTRFNSTTVIATGTVAGNPAGQPGKTVSVETTVHEGRVEDLLWLFTRHPATAMQGPITLQAKFTIPPGPPGFLTRLKADGEFAISRGRFTNPKAQTPINRLSASAAGESKRQMDQFPTVAAADVRGLIKDRDGVARLLRVDFEVPGVRGRLAGTFALRDKSIRLDGILRTSGKMSDTTSGFKALMLHVIGPFWRTEASVKSVPFHISGSASHPVFRLKLHS